MKKKIKLCKMPVSMAKEIKVMCMECCVFSRGVSGDFRSMSAFARKHCRETGHTVSLEYWMVRSYSKSKKAKR